MKLHTLLFICLTSLPISSMANDCELGSFPDFWADAQDQVSRLQATLNKAEKAKPYSLKSTKAFRQSLTVCAAKKSSIFNDPTAASGSGGSITQSKCEAMLICSRLAILSDDF